MEVGASGLFGLRGEKRTVKKVSLFLVLRNCTQPKEARDRG